MELVYASLRELPEEHYICPDDSSVVVEKDGFRGNIVGRAWGPFAYIWCARVSSESDE